MAASALLAGTGWGATSSVWEVAGYSDFSKGVLHGLSLTADGNLRAGPFVSFDAALDQPALWSIVGAPEGGVYAATGHRGRVVRIAPDGKIQPVWTAPEPEVFAICMGAKGVLYAATSPNGGVYRIENGKATEIWHSDAKYIWALQAGTDGSIYVGAGDPGRVTRIDAGGKAEVFYETGQSNVTALALGANGHLYAGTDPNGLLYDISGPRQGNILYDSPLPEIRAIAVNPQGTVYAAAMGGSVTSRTGAIPASAAAATTVVTAANPTVITVTEGKENNVQSPAESKLKTDTTRGAASSSLVTGAQTTATVDVSGVDKSAIYRIDPDRTVETLRTSKDDNIYDLLLEGSAVLFSTDVDGRIYRLEGGKVSLVAEAGSGEVTRLLKSNGGFYAGLSSPARLLAFQTNASQPGSYESEIHDSTTVARWGHLQWHGAGSGVVFRTRSGNAARPDSTWSAWSAPMTDPASALIQSPNARFIQWRAEWPAGANGSLDIVDIGYLPQNTPPSLHSITVTSVVTTNPSKQAATAAAATSSYTVTVTDTGTAPAASSSTSATQTVSQQQTTQTQVSWQADDADGDKLVYAVYFRGDDQSEWMLIRSRMFENALLLDADTLADGRYFFKVVASDSPSNAAPYARQTELVSGPVLIDNTPPLVTPGQPQRNGDSLDITVDAVDKTSSLRRCEFSLDAGSWQPIEAADGITDSPREQFLLHVDKLRPGEHLLVFRVYDSANNVGLARVVVH
jgi:hypothetical protein